MGELLSVFTCWCLWVRVLSTKEMLLSILSLDLGVVLYFMPVPVFCWF